MQHPARMQRIVVALGLPALFSGCSTLAPTPSTLPTGAVAMVAPQVYQDWLQTTETCSGLAGNLSTIQFYVVPGVNTFSTEDGPKVGLWSREGSANRIVIAGNYVDHEMVV